MLDIALPRQKNSKRACPAPLDISRAFTPLHADVSWGVCEGGGGASHKNGCEGDYPCKTYLGVTFMVSR